jgi:hypothetical protein
MLLIYCSRIIKLTMRVALNYAIYVNTTVLFHARYKFLCYQATEICVRHNNL